MQFEKSYLIQELTYLNTDLRKHVKNMYLEMPKPMKSGWTNMIKQEKEFREAELI